MSRERKDTIFISYLQTIRRNNSLAASFSAQKYYESIILRE